MFGIFLYIVLIYFSVRDNMYRDVYILCTVLGISDSRCTTLANVKGFLLGGCGASYSTPLDHQTDLFHCCHSKRRLWLIFLETLGRTEAQDGFTCLRAVDSFCIFYTNSTRRYKCLYLKVIPHFSLSLSSTKFTNQKKVLCRSNSLNRV